MNRTATDRINLAIAAGTFATVDHETKSFIGFRFKLADEPRDTVVRIHKTDTALIEALNGEAS